MSQIKWLLFSCLFVVIFLTLPQLTLAQTPSIIEEQPNNIDCSKSSNINNPACGGYQPNDLVNIIIRTSEIILGITGSLSLLAFVYGGFMFLISAGSSEKIEQARKIILGAVIGMFIVFGSYLIIQFVLQTLGVEQQRLQNWNKPQQILQNIK